MFAYYTAARWFGITLDLVLGMFCAIIGLLELYTVKDSSTAGMSFCFEFIFHKIITIEMGFALGCNL